jgi:acetophenone carboxylase
VLFQATENISVRLDGGTAYQCCSRCNTELGPVSENYKLHCVRQDNAVNHATPLAGDPHRFIDALPVFRQFFCPGCGALIENEVAADGDPILRDIMIANAELR